MWGQAQKLPKLEGKLVPKWDTYLAQLAGSHSCPSKSKKTRLPCTRWGKNPKYTLAVSPWAAFLGGRRSPAPRGPGPSKSPVPSYPHQHQAGKRCLDKLTLIFMIGRRLRARLDGLFNCVCKMSRRGQLCQCRMKRGGPSPQAPETLVDKNCQDASLQPEGLETQVDSPVW